MRLVQVIDGFLTLFIRHVFGSSTQGEVIDHVAVAPLNLDHLGGGYGVFNAEQIRCCHVGRKAQQDAAYGSSTGSLSTARWSAAGTDVQNGTVSSPTTRG